MSFSYPVEAAMKRHLRLGIGLLALALLLPLAPGQDDAKGKKGGGAAKDKERHKDKLLDLFFKRLEKSGDDKISEKEFVDAAKYLFDALDHNRDGILSKEELRRLQIRAFAIQGT